MGKQGVYVTSTKNRQSRTIDIDPSVTALLKELKRQQRVKNVDGYVFTRRDGTVMFPQTPTKYLKTLGEKYGFANLHPHVLRHTAATIAILNGADIASVARKLGQQTISVTLDIYTHANTESIRKANQIYHGALYGTSNTEEKATNS